MGSVSLGAAWNKTNRTPPALGGVFVMRHTSEEVYYFNDAPDWQGRVGGKIVSSRPPDAGEPSPGSRAASTGAVGVYWPGRTSPGGKQRTSHEITVPRRGPF